MPAIIEGFNEVLGILKEMASGVKTAMQIPENQKKEMKLANGDRLLLI
jgi:hypothetical protein